MSNLAGRPIPTVGHTAFTLAPIETMSILKGLIQTIVVVVTFSLHFVAPVTAGTIGLAKALEKVAPSDILANAERFGAVLADQPIVPILNGNKVVGHAFLNTDFSGAIGYSGKPIVVLIALDVDGKIAGAGLVQHAEPIVLGTIYLNERPQRVRHQRLWNILSPFHKRVF